MNEYQKLQLKEALMSIVADTAVFLFGEDLGFFGNGTSAKRGRRIECLTWTPGATDPNDIAVGCGVKMSPSTRSPSRLGRASCWLSTREFANARRFRLPIACSSLES